jgi:ATP/maltotriose-dependent transcriptional regulator MalT
MKLEAGEEIDAGRSHIIKRPRLTRLLDETSARIILLVAPAGYGKTTLAREWLANRPHVWYRGTQAAADAAALALAIANTCSTIIPGAGDRLKARLRISRAPTEEVERLADLLAEDLRDWPQGTWIGVDDYQFACDSDPAEQFVEHLLRSCGVQLLATSRCRPRWATARRMIYGEIHEIGRNLLAMNRDEAGQVLQDRGVDDPNVLLSLADGWPALIGLAALSPNADMPGETVSDELYDFFAEELYQAATPELRQAFRRLSLPRYVTPDIAEAVVGDHASEALVRGVELGFFASSPRERLELHPLLRRFLTSKFRKRDDDPTGKVIADITDILIRHAEWDDVFALALRFSDNRLLAKLFDASLVQMLDEARLPTLANWIAAATSRGADFPIVDLADAELAFRRGDLRRAEALACQAARRFERAHRLSSRAFWIAGSSAHLMFRDEAALEYFRDAETTSTSGSDNWQALWGQFLASETLERETDAAELLCRLTQLSGGSVDELLRIATGRFRMAQLSGSIQTALQSIEELTHLASRSRDPLVRSSFLNSYGSLLVLSGEYEKALNEGKAEIAFVLHASLDFVLPFAHFLVATAYLGLRRFRDCRTHLATCERIAMKSEFVTCNMCIVDARLRLSTQLPREAVKILERGYGLAKTCQAAHPEYLAWWSLAHAVAGNDAVANELAARSETLSRRIEVTALVPWTRAVLAVHANGMAHDTVNEAFSIAGQSGNLDAFITAYRACPQLLKLLLSDAHNHEHLKQILERARDHSLARTLGIDLGSQQSLATRTLLTKREQEVIELVSQGLTNKEIGRTLYITEATVKVHVRKICTKFGVRSRTEAAMRAAELTG